MKKRVLSFVVTLALLMGAVPGFPTQTARAESTSAYVVSGDGGTATFSDGSTQKTVSRDSTLTVVVKPNPGYKISKIWVEGQVIGGWPMKIYEVDLPVTKVSENNYTFKASANATNLARVEFAPELYTVTWKSQDGSTTLETDTNIAYGTKPSYNGAAPTKPATAEYSYAFAGWATSTNQESGTAMGSLPAVSKNTTYYAAFSKTAYTYTVTVANGSGGGSFKAGAAVSIRANAPASGKQFKGWTGADGLTFTSGSAASDAATFTMPSKNVTLTATYEDIPVTTYKVTVTSGTGGGSYEAGAAVTITANTAPSGKQFKEWTGADGLTFTSGSATSATATFAMPTRNVALTATYEDIPVTPVSAYTVTVTNGSGGGSYEEGESVSITADAAPDGQQFSKWTGTDGLTFTSGSAASATATFTMPARNVTLAATYEDIPVTTYKVTVTNGSGSDSYEEGASVTIIADAAPDGQQFKEWSGADGLTFTSGSATSATATFTMPARNIELTATYREDILDPTLKINITNEDYDPEMSAIITQDESITLTGTITGTDTISQVTASYADYTQETKTASITGTTSWSVDIPLTIGTNTVTIAAEGTRGSLASKTVYINRTNTELIFSNNVVVADEEDYQTVADGIIACWIDDNGTETQTDDLIVLLSKDNSLLLSQIQEGILQQGDIYMIPQNKLFLTGFTAKYQSHRAPRGTEDYPSKDYPDDGYEEILFTSPTMEELFDGDVSLDFSGGIDPDDPVAFALLADGSQVPTDQVVVKRRQSNAVSSMLAASNADGSSESENSENDWLEPDDLSIKFHVGENDSGRMDCLLEVECTWKLKPNPNNQNSQGNNGQDQEEGPESGIEAKLSGEIGLKDLEYTGCFEKHSGELEQVMAKITGSVHNEIGGSIEAKLSGKDLVDLIREKLFHYEYENERKLGFVKLSGTDWFDNKLLLGVVALNVEGPPIAGLAKNKMGVIEEASVIPLILLCFYLDVDGTFSVEVGFTISSSQPFAYGFNIQKNGYTGCYGSQQDNRGEVHGEVGNYTIDCYTGFTEGKEKTAAFSAEGEISFLLGLGAGIGPMWAGVTPAMGDVEVFFEGNVRAAGEIQVYPEFELAGKASAQLAAGGKMDLDAGVSIKALGGEIGFEFDKELLRKNFFEISSSTYYLEGTVYESDTDGDKSNNAVIPYATVTLTDDEGEQKTTTADENGRYRISNIPDGEYTLRVEKPGYTPDTLTLTIPLEDGSWHDEQDVFVDPARSGTCGDDLNWALDDAGKLTITGTGAMTDFEWRNGESTVPWYRYRNSIQTVEIGYGVTKIGDYVFQNCTPLTTVTIPASMTSIGNYAFDGCTALADIYYGGTRARWSAVFIGSDNTPLDNATIHYSIASGTCGQNYWMLCEDGTLRIYGSGELTGWRSASSAPWYGYRSKIKTIDIGAGVTITSDGKNASSDRDYSYVFADCPALTTVNIGNGATITCNAYDNSTGARYYEGSYSYSYVFSGCPALTTVNIGEGVTIVSGSYNGALSYEKTCNSYVFGDCTALETVNIGRDTTITSNSTSNSPDAIFNEPCSGSRVFNNCTALTTVNIGDGVTITSNSSGWTGYRTSGSFSWVFSNCTALTTVIVGDGVTITRSVYGGRSYVFSDCPASAIMIKKGVTSIDDKAFYSCADLVGSVTIPEDVTSIGDEAFSGCSNLTDVYYAGTQAQWDAISIGSGNDPLTSAAIHYNSGSSCGNGLNWLLYNDGRLVISGSGAMLDYTSSSDAPWGSRRSQIKKVIIGIGITSVGNHAFDGCTELTSVTIPASVKSIGSFAFNGCSALTAVTIPYAVTNIGTYAFDGCAALTSVIIPDGVKDIRNYMFNGCAALKSVTIPASVTRIGNHTFNGCVALTDVYYSETRAQWNTISIESDNDSLNGAFLHVANACGDNLFWTVYNGERLVVSGSGAMWDYTYDSDVPWYSQRLQLKEVVIEDGVTSIGSHAFNTCSVLTDVYYGGTAVQWDAIAVGSSNVPITNGATIHFSDGTTYVAHGTCGDDLTWRLESGALTIIGTGEMNNYSWSSGAPWDSSCESIKTVTIGSGVTSIGNHAFDGCSALTTVTISDSVTSIGDYALSECSALTDVYYDGTAAQWYEVSVGSYNTPIMGEATIHASDAAFNGMCGANLTWTLKNTVLTIAGTGEMDNYYSWSSGAPWDSSRESIKTVTIGSGVTSIGNHAFDGCSALTEVTISDGVTSIGDYAFDGCYILATVTIPNGVTSIGDHAFDGCRALTTVAIPNSVTSIERDAFSYCDALTDVYYGGTSTQWHAILIWSGNEPIMGKATIHTSDATFNGTCGEDLIWTLKNGVLTITGTGAMTNYGWHDAPWDYPAKVIIGRGVASIGDRAFEGCYALTTVTIPDSVASIGDHAFGECYALTTVTIPDSVTSIGDYVFYGCSALTKVTLSNSVTSIGDRAFSGCSALTTVTIPDSITSIGDYAFYGCRSLTMVTLPNNVTSISDGAFDWCGALTDIYYGGTELQWSEISIGSYNTGLTGATIHFSDGTTHSPSGTCGDSLTWTLISGVLTISGTGAMTDWSWGSDVPWYGFGIKEVSLGNSITSIGSYAFNHCSNLTSVMFGNNVTSIGDHAFNSCSALTSVTIPNSVLSIGDGAFNSAGLTSIMLGSSVTSIGYSAFYSCTSLTSVTIPVSVTSIDRYAFGGCNALTDVYYGGTEAQWFAIVNYYGNDPLTTANIHYASTAPNNSINAVSRSQALPISGASGSSSYTITSSDSVTVAVSEQSTTFSDVTDDSWAKESIGFVAARGIFAGGSDGNFHPKATMTRAAIAQVLYNIGRGQDGSSGTGSVFTDVEDFRWYTDAANWAKKSGVMSGYADGSFGATDTVTREQIAQILYNYAQSVLGLDVSANRSVLGKFTDHGSVGGWAADAMSWAVSSGLFTSTDAGELNPKGEFTRAGMSVLMTRFVEMILQ